MAPTLVALFDHCLLPGDDPDVVDTIAAILTRPCFEMLTRVWINIEERDLGHDKTTTEQVRAYFLDPTSEAVELDSGRGRETVASARIWTGRHVRNSPEPRRSVNSFLIVPHRPDSFDTVLSSILELAQVLEVVAGYVTLEPDYELGFRTALCSPPRHEDFPDHTKERAQERKAHSRYRERLATELSGPDWGMFLSAQHLARLHATRATWASLVQVHELSSEPANERVFVQLTPDPRDALTPAFGQVLARARTIFASLRMDIAKVPVGWD